jgi:hypothetical protein|tara:strand:+ start:16 stop:264 length:249 start_codon:yes stop_codon:yes gene_type:complete
LESIAEICCHKNLWVLATLGRFYITICLVSLGCEQSSFHFIVFYSSEALLPWVVLAKSMQKRYPKGNIAIFNRWPKGYLEIN